MTNATTPTAQTNGTDAAELAALRAEVRDLRASVHRLEFEAEGFQETVEYLFHEAGTFRGRLRHVFPYKNSGEPPTAWARIVNAALYPDTCGVGPHAAHAACTWHTYRRPARWHTYRRPTRREG